MKYWRRCGSDWWIRSKEASLEPCRARSGFCRRSFRTKFVDRYWIFIVFEPAKKWLVALWRSIYPSGVSYIIYCCL